jgi:hypothetical protein
MNLPMDSTAAEQFMQRLMEDPALRSAFESDPEETIRRSGLELSDELLRSARRVSSIHAVDQELVERVSMRSLSRGTPPHGSI